MESAADAATWRDGLVPVRLGSFSLDSTLLRAGLLVGNTEAGCNAPMFVIDRQLRSAGELVGPLIITLGPIPVAMVARSGRTSRETD